AALVLMLRELNPPMTSLREGWRGFEAGLEGRVGVFLLQFVLLALAFAVFDLVPTWAVASLVAEESRALATGIVLAVKNLPVIALTFLWLIGLARFFVVSGALSPGATSRPGRPIPPGPPCPLAGLGALAFLVPHLAGLVPYLARPVPTRSGDHGVRPLLTGAHAVDGLHLVPRGSSLPDPARSTSALEVTSICGGNSPMICIAAAPSAAVEAAQASWTTLSRAPASAAARAVVMTQQSVETPVSSR